MGQFLRFAALILLVLIGFGSGICGLFGLAMTVPDLFGPRPVTASDVGLVLVLSAVGGLIAVGCFFGARALARNLRRSAQTKPPQ
jgi:hypothetical protein